MLEVIQHQQEMLLLEVRFEHLDQRSRAALLQAQRMPDGRRDEIRAGDRSQRDEAGAIGELTAQVMGHSMPSRVLPVPAGRSA